MGKLTINLDATALGHSGCIKDLYYTVIGSLDEQGQSLGGYKELTTDPSLIYGVAVHKFIDVMYKTGGVYPTAMKAALQMFDLPKRESAKKKWLSDPIHLKTVCYNVWSNYVESESSFSLIELPSKDKPTPASEITFKIKYYEDEQFIVNICGTIDKIGKFSGGCYAIGDWKTSSTWDNVGYFTQYQLSRQLRMYKLALRLMTLAEPDSVIGKIGATKVGCFIDAIFLSTKPNDVKFERSEVFQISEQELDEFQLELDKTIQRLIVTIKSGYLAKEGILNGHCIKWQNATEKNFVKCIFWDCCRHGGNVEQVLLQRNFTQKQFDPLNYNEV